MKKLAYYFSFIPFQLNFFVLVFIGLCIFRLTQIEYLLDPEKPYFAMILRTLDLFIIAFSILILSLAFITTLLCWIYFWIYKASVSESPVQATIGDGKTAQAGYVALGLTAKGIIKPLLGHVKGRIVFAGNHITPALTLDQPVFTTNKIIRNSLKASRPVWVPDIKENEVKKVVIYFEDMFRLFSFPFVLNNSQKLLTIPAEQEKMNVDVNPDKTIEQEQRIQTPKRIQGELFNYKHFEAGDDIRRIVWKIYAKNKELVVKIPETMDPYASHIYFYPSFYSVPMVASDIKNAMLNYYKVKIRQVYEALSRTEFSVKYLPDQELTTPDGSSDEDPVWLYQLSTSVWQNQKEVTDSITTKREGIFCISSLIPFAEVEEMLTNKSPDTLVFFVKTSEMWRSRRIFNIFSVIIKTDEHPLDTLKRKWLFSSGRRKILNNEKQIQQYLDDQLYKHIIV